MNLDLDIPASGGGTKETPESEALKPFLLAS